MKKFFDIIKLNPLFSGIEADDLDKLLNCLSGSVVSYKKNDIILLCGDAVKFIGILLSGSIKIVKEDMEGNVNIIAKPGPGEVFAEVFAFAGIPRSPVTVQAAEDCNVLLIDYKRMTKSCSSICPFHTKLIENMLGLIAGKNIMLNQKIEIMSKRTLREKLLVFLNIQRKKSNSNRFIIPYNREALAHYLCVDRSAMSRELCKMRDEGLIKFNKNEFELHKMN